MVIDVEILHEIVSRAQELLPTLPERERLPTSALFSAYDEIMPKLGVDKDHDSRYARVLFKIGGFGGIRDSRTLLEKFEEVLSNMGITVEFNSHNDSEEGSQYDEDESEGDLQSVADDISYFEEQRQAGGRRRRNSESSIWAPAIASRPRQDSTRRNSHSYGDQIKEQFQNNEAVLESLPSTRLLNTDKETDNEDGNVGTWLESQSQSPRKSTPGRSGSAHGSMRIRRRSTSRGRPRSSVIRERNEPDTNTFFFEDQDEGQREGVPNTHPETSSFHASESLMQVKASVILDDHLRFLAKQQLRLWRDKAMRLREDNPGLNIMAAFFSRKILCQVVLVLWRDKAVALRKAKATEVFFKGLHLRVDRAREVYLKQTAFTHWSIYANEHVRRTELARRHIVRLRMFNAWREITVVNELKVRRQVIKKFFGLWKRHHTNLTHDNSSALQVYQGGLVQKILRDWIHRHREAQATALWAEHAKRRALFHWIVVSHETWELHQTAEDERRLRLTLKPFSKWRTKTRVHFEQLDEAGARYKISLCRSVLSMWRKETDVIPATTIVQTEVARRLIRETLSTWRRRTIQEKTAASLNRMKIIREALTLWRHQLRAKVVTNTIATHTKTRILHNLTMNYRSHDTDRKLIQKRLRESFEFWVHRWQQSRDQRWEQEDLAQSFAVERSQNLALAQWYSRMGHRKSLEVTALDHYEPRLLKRVVLTWLEKLQHQQRLQKWSRDAEFYFLAKKSVKRWKASTEAVQREKRKVAFAEVRRMVKYNLVRGVLQTWREQATDILDLQGQASSVRENRNVILGMEIFDRWRGRTEELAELEALSRESVLKKQLSIWREKSDRLQALETEATITYQERRQSRVVRKWSLAALQLRAQSNYAADVCEKNARKTFRRMFSYWHQKALQRRPSPRVETSESDQLLGTTARAETWSDYGGDGGIDEWARGLEDATSSTPIPGYLATPSKVNRAQRVKAVAARFSTTPKGPLSTPFEKQLRAQYPPFSLRKGLARSTLGGFADIPEHSMNNERESGA